MSDPNSRNPLHGVTLAMMLEYLVKRYGWEELGRRIEIRCFNFEPSIKSSLQFLRRTPWARAKVEALYLRCVENRFNDTASYENVDVVPPELL